MPRKIERTKDNKINRLLKKRHQLRGAIQANYQTKRQAENNIKELSREICAINDQTAEIKKTGYLLITDHAILRYMERVMGVDVDAIIDEIQDHEINELDFSKISDDHKFTDSKGYTWVFGDGVVITILQPVTRS